MVFSFAVYSNGTLKTVRGCESLKKEKSQGKAVEVTVISKEVNFKDFCLDFVQEFGHGHTKCFKPKLKVL